jgi:transmembrane sensor
MNNQYSNTENPGSTETEKLILDHVSKLKVPAGRSAGDALAALKARIAEQERIDHSPKKTDMRLVYWVSSIAAGLLVLLAVWQIWFRPSLTFIIAERGTHKEYRLPDGSVVNLNADSKISFIGRDFSNNRHLSLKGEAFFDITKGSAFTISTSFGEIRVLGTSFNVYARDNPFTVSCLTGKILVSARNQSVTISPGESATIAGEHLISYTDADMSLTTKWIDGEFNFINSSLDLVFDEMERQFNVKFAGDTFKNKFFTGSFSNKDLQVALEIICIPMGLNYEIGSNGEIFVTENPK